MSTNSLSDLLSSYGACSEACVWAEGRLVDEAAYLECQSGDWLLWILTQLGLPRPQLVLAACACARTALRYVPAGEERPLLAIEVAEAWARGGDGAPTQEQVRAAAGDAYAAATDAADAAAYAAYAAHAAADAAARTKALAECVDIAAAAYAADAADTAAVVAVFAAAAAAHAAAAHAYDAADTADTAVSDAADAAINARAQALAECADIVRSVIPWGDVVRLIRS